MVEDCCADDPELDPRTTAEMLDRYEGKVFWRAPLREIARAYSEWMAKLADGGPQKP